MPLLPVVHSLRMNAVGKGGDAYETLELIGSLRSTINEQKKEMDSLRQRLGDAAVEQEAERDALSRESARLVEQLAQVKGEIARLQDQLEMAKSRKADAEKEQEDLLILLEEISNKRKADKARMRSAGLEVSDDEEEDDDEDDDDNDASSQRQSQDGERPES